MKGEIKESGPARLNTSGTPTATVKADGPSTFKFGVANK